MIRFAQFGAKSDETKSDLWLSDTKWDWVTNKKTEAKICDQSLSSDEFFTELETNDQDQVTLLIASVFSKALLKIKGLQVLQEKYADNILFSEVV